jgi:hypothetical protein
MTYALREARSRAPAALPAQMPTGDRSDCPLRTERAGHSFQISFHVPGHGSRPSVTEGDDKAQVPPGLSRDAGERAWRLPEPHAAQAWTSASMLWSAGTGQPCSAGRTAVVPEQITEHGRVQRRAHADQHGRRPDPPPLPYQGGLRALWTGAPAADSRSMHVSALWPSLGGGLVSGGPAGRGRGLGRHDALASGRRAAEADRRYELSLGATPAGRPGRMTGFPGRGRSRERSEGC